MVVDDVQVAKPSKPRLARWIGGILAGIALTLLIIGLTLWGLAGWSVYQISSMFRHGQSHVVVDQPTVVRQVRALQRIETVSYSLDKILSGERENPIFPQFLAGDRLLLVAHGEVIAGVDLSKLRPTDVEVHGQSVSIRLPAAEILTASLDNAKTRVYSRDTGLFSTPDPNLEGEVREEAVRQLRTAALDDGILKTAAANADQTLDHLLASLGFSHIDIRDSQNHIRYSRHIICDCILNSCRVPILICDC